jgi:iron complex transport system substrate-binding protein
MKRKALLALTAVLACGLVSTFATQMLANAVDPSGAEVEIPVSVERVASIDGIATFYVYALGAGDRLVAAWYVGVKGVGQASDALLRLEPRLDEVLMFGEANVEEILARDPQLVLADAARHASFAEQTGDVGITVIQFSTETPDGVKEETELIGRALGPDSLVRAQAFNADYSRVFNAVTSALSDVSPDERADVLFLGTSLNRVASGDMYQRHLVEAAGGTFVSASLQGGWNTVGLEQVLIWDPDVVVIPPYGGLQPSDVLGNPDWQSISAVRNARVYRMPRLVAPWDTPVPESILGIVWLADLLYPGRVDLDSVSEVERFYTTYYGLELTEDDWEELARR